MAKVHPSGGAITSATVEAPAPAPAALTVWKKSLLFNFNGFAAFDGKGDLVFRVDDYVAGGGGEIVLMNGTGRPLLTARRKKLSWGEKWLVHEGEEEEKGRAKLSVKKGGGMFWQRGSVLATAKLGGGDAGLLEVEGSYGRRSCEVYDEGRRKVAEIRRKEGARGVGLGADVFSLVVQPGFDAAVAMVLVLLLEQMFGSR